MNIKTVNTSQEAWEYINEYILLNEVKLKQEGAGREGNSSISYDNLIFIRKAWIDPDIDFGKLFAYKMQKWTHLVNNYIDINHLDIVKTEILENERKKKRTYNTSIQFTNYHGSGKGCLLSLTFSRRINSDIPILIFNTRATEVTRRLLIDLLFIQRIGEYVYGINKAFSINFYAQMAFISCESFLNYFIYKGIQTFGLAKTHPFQKLIRDTHKKFLTCNPVQDISYTSHRRIAQHLQGAKYKNMKASELSLINKPTIDYPVDCLTDQQRSAYRKQLK